MKISVIYHSVTGNTKRMAEVMADAMQSVAGVEARTFGLDGVDKQFLDESRCVVIGTPTYLATMSAAMKTWLDQTSAQYALAGKLGGAFATANYMHGGAEIAIQSLLSHLLVKGMVVYSGGGAMGKPVIHLGPLAIGGKLEEADEYFRIYGQRMATKAAELFACQNR